MARRQNKKEIVVPETVAPAAPKVPVYKLMPATDGFLLLPGAPQIWIDKSGNRQRSYITETIGGFTKRTNEVKVCKAFQLFFRNKVGDLIKVQVNHRAFVKESGSERVWSPALSFIKDMLSQYGLVYEGTDELDELVTAFRSIKNLSKPFVFTKTESDGFAYYNPVKVAPVLKDEDTLAFYC